MKKMLILWTFLISSMFAEFKPVTLESGDIILRNQISDKESVALVKESGDTLLVVFSDKILVPLIGNKTYAYLENEKKEKLKFQVEFGPHFESIYKEIKWYNFKTKRFLKKSRIIGLEVFTSDLQRHQFIFDTEGFNLNF